MQAELAAARQQAAEIRTQAQADKAAIIEEARAEARTAAQAVTEQAREASIEADKAKAISELRGSVGTMAADLASRIVGESVSDDARASRVIDRFIDDLDSSTAGRPRCSGPAERPSRRFESGWRRSSTTPPSATSLAAGGTGVLTVVSSAEQERSLGHLWADPAVADSVKDGVLVQVFGERVPTLSQDMVKQVTHARWSDEGDMMDALKKRVPR